MNNRYQELKNIIESDSQIISAQLQGIDSNLLGAFFSILVSVLLGNAFGLLIYWIPASFIFLLILMSINLIKMIIDSVKMIKKH
jgi:hypothetical protein